MAKAVKVWHLILPEDVDDQMISRALGSGFSQELVRNGYQPHIHGKVLLGDGAHPEELISVFLSQKDFPVSAATLQQDLLAALKKLEYVPTPRSRRF